MYKTIKIDISEDLEDRLKTRAADRNISIEEFIVEWLSEQTESSHLVEQDPISPLIGTLSFENNDISQRHDNYLEEAIKMEID